MTSRRARRRATRVLALLALGTGAAVASGAAQRPVVVELFTSLGCSDCPPADALLARISGRDSEVLALDLHVTYWNNASWADPYSLSGADRLQNAYAALRHDSEVYTPEAVVDGGWHFIGSDASAMAAALAQAKARIAAGPLIPTSIHEAQGQLTITIGSGAGSGTVWLFGFDPARSTRVQGGENAGATISEVNVVSSITPLGQWRGRGLRFKTPPPAGARFAVIVQQTDGTITGASST
ncbi:MAG TPA: DUF1223 domain-containing protein [Steroidobacteraceae bacterium]|nr:DUF1223 domain-containing protein [Steroidobacteraceae bacterium]